MLNKLSLMGLYKEYHKAKQFDTLSKEEASERFELVVRGIRNTLRELHTESLEEYTTPFEIGCCSNLWKLGKVCIGT